MGTASCTCEFACGTQKAMRMIWIYVPDRTFYFTIECRPSAMCIEFAIGLIKRQAAPSAHISALLEEIIVLS